MNFKKYFSVFLEESSFPRTIKELDQYLLDSFKGNIDWMDEYTFEKIIPIIKKFLISKGFVDEGFEGRNRIAMRRNHVIVKIPKHLAGMDDNYYEHSNQKVTYPMDGEKRARNKLIVLPKLGFPLLMMEHVEHLPVGENPEWASFYDAGQVGKNKKGVIKGYDYGLH